MHNVYMISGFNTDWLGPGPVFQCTHPKSNLAFNSGFILIPIPIPKTK